MSCDKFKKYELGEIKKRDFRKHLKNCNYCQEEMKSDERLMSMARLLKGKVEAPFLWEKIRQSLEKEPQTEAAAGVKKPVRPAFWLIPATAVVLVIISIAFFYLFRPERTEPRLLSKTALNRVEKTEKKYIRAILELEKSALPAMAKFDLNLVQLYRNRLETIDEQVQKCKEAIAENPANAHLRRYLLAALQDKKQTLTELLNLEPQSLQENE